MPDLIDNIFDSESEDDYFPGSKRLRRPEPEPEDDIEGEAWRENYTVKMVGGVERRFYAIGALADALDVSVQTVRLWISKGYIPQAPYRLPTSVIHGQKYQGRRLYTEPMIDAAVKAFAKRGLLDTSRVEWKKYPDLPIELHEKWTAIHREETN